MTGGLSHIIKGWKHHCQSSFSPSSASRGGLFRGVSFLFSFHHPQVKHLCLEHPCLRGHTPSLVSPPVHSFLEQGLLCIFLVRMFYDSTTFEELIPVALPKGKEIRAFWESATVVTCHCARSRLTGAGRCLSLLVVLLISFLMLFLKSLRLG